MKPKEQREVLEAYRICFSSPEGQTVLQDMIRSAFTLRTEYAPAFMLKVQEVIHQSKSMSRGERQEKGETADTEEVA